MTNKESVIRGKFKTELQTLVAVTSVSVTGFLYTYAKYGIFVMLVRSLPKAIFHRELTTGHRAAGCYKDVSEQHTKKHRLEVNNCEERAGGKKFERD